MTRYIEIQMTARIYYKQRQFMEFHVQLRAKADFPQEIVGARSNEPILLLVLLR